MHAYPEAYTFDNLFSIIDSNDSCPTPAHDELQRIVDLAERRAGARGNALDDEKVDCLIATDWTGFAEGEFGYDNGALNQFAIGILNHTASVGKGATLFTDTYVIQNGWLKSGDGRRAQVEAYVDDDYDGAEEGEMWIPKGAQDYICIVALSKELVHDSPSAAEAM